MTTEEWLAKALADRPPRTPEMTAILRPLWAPAVPRIREAALAATRTASASPQELPGRSTSAQR